MHIICTQDEFSDLYTFAVSKLPEGTTIVVVSKKGKALRRYIVKNNNLEVEVDFKEHNRKWRKGEKEEFEKKLTRDFVVDFFIENAKKDDYEVHYRKYSSCNDAIYNLFNYIDPSISVSRGNRIYPTFQIRIPRNISGQDLEDAIEEVEFILAKLRPVYKNCKPPIFIDIMEHTLSEFGSYSLNWDKKTGFTLQCSPSFAGKKNKFKTVKDMILYISKEHWYE